MHRYLVILSIMVFPLILAADPHPHGGDGGSPTAQATTGDTDSIGIGLPDTPKVEGHRPWMDAFFCKRLPFAKIPFPRTSFRLPSLGLPDIPVFGWYGCP